MTDGGRGERDVGAVESVVPQRLIYSLSVETFMDGNGDGVGDFAGLRRRLDYLEGLGVDASGSRRRSRRPNRDDGYDIADYYGVDPRLGSSGDFAEFMQERDAAASASLLDLVVNHTSDRHPWFLDARAPRIAVSRLVRLVEEAAAELADRAWSSPASRSRPGPTRRRHGEWYFHRFYDFQPDLNTDNPRVREEIHRIIGYWLAARRGWLPRRRRPVYAREAVRRTAAARSRTSSTCASRATSLQWRRGDAILLGEANIVPRDERTSYFADGEGLHLIFNFWVNQHLFLALATGDARPLAAALRADREHPARAPWAHFLRNHDELDLGRLTDAQRAEVFAGSGPSPRCSSTAAASGDGSRRCSAHATGSSLRTASLFSLPGAPVVRYGEEIGMGENLRLKERNAIRTPMQWSAEPNGGFSTAGKLVVQSSPTGRTATTRSTSRTSSGGRAPSFDG